MKYVNLIIVCAFFSAGIVNLAGPSFIRAEFAKWGYPNGFRVAIAIIELIGSLALLFATTRIAGASILLVVILGVLASFSRSREWMKMQYPLVLLLLLIVTLSQTFPLG
ncbi:DoxX family protein [Paraburkholderia pallida]|uniref:DoxX family protein n=1 Tax=Paraburkholderia pallida TaxID=2547399 RepID=A0A4P7D1V6_9BURK|nr:DoxX family protein [Paraburkholderia pallida]QBR02619.1 hypothetical protein E1956_35945 [Paraburkholderia pallida]